jgi:hypothetical protein
LLQTGFNARSYSIAARNNGKTTADRAKAKLGRSGFQCVSSIG